MTKILNKRGLKENLPILDTAELGFCTDTEELYIGNNGENVYIGGNGGEPCRITVNPNLMVDGDFCLVRDSERELTFTSDWSDYLTGFFSIQPVIGAIPVDATYDDSMEDAGYLIKRHIDGRDPREGMIFRLFYYFQESEGMDFVFGERNNDSDYTLTVNFRMLNEGSYIYLAGKPELEFYYPEPGEYEVVVNIKGSDIKKKFEVLRFFYGPEGEGDIDAKIFIKSVKLEEGLVSTPFIRDLKTDRDIIDRYVVTMHGSGIPIATADSLILPISISFSGTNYLTRFPGVEQLIANKTTLVNMLNLPDFSAFGSLEGYEAKIVIGETSFGDGPYLIVNYNDYGIPSNHRDLSDYNVMVCYESILDLR